MILRRLKKPEWFGEMITSGAEIATDSRADGLAPKRYHNQMFGIHLTHKRGRKMVLVQSLQAKINRNQESSRILDFVYVAQ